MIKEAENKVTIEGLLSEVDLSYGSFKKKKTNEMVNSIGGTIKVQVNQNIDGKPVMLEVPVHMFASETTNKGTKNPAQSPYLCASFFQLLTSFTFSIIN